MPGTIRSSRARHERVSSVSLRPAERRRLGQAPARRLVPRVVLVAASLAFVLYFGSHLLEHRRRGTSHFHPGAGSAKEQRAAGTAVPEQEEQQHDIVWAGDAERDFHDAHLSEEAAASRRKNAKVPTAKVNTARPISVSGILPSLHDLPLDSALRRQWEDTLESLERSAEKLFAATFVDSPAASGFSLPSGVPGTGIQSDEEARRMQRYMDCIASEGSWVHDPMGTHLAQAGAGLPVHKQLAVFASCDKSYFKHRDSTSATSNAWDVRSSLKWRWGPSQACAELKHPAWLSPITPPSRQKLCRFLRHKNILLLGDAPTQYLIHDLLLDWTAEHTLTCYGDLYCKEHGICGDGLGYGGEIGRSWKNDVRVFNALPDPPGIASSKPRLGKRSGEEMVSEIGLDNQTHVRHKREEGNVSTARTYGTILRYRRTDSLFLNSSPTHARHQPGYIHPDTGVRDINMYAIPDSRRSDLVIVSKAPIPLPLPEADSSIGAVRSGSGKRLARQVRELQERTFAGEERAIKAIRLVQTLVQDVWLPELMESLRVIKAPPAPADSLLVYRGGWRMQPGCASPAGVDTGNDTSFDWSGIWQYTGDGPPPRLHQPSLKQLLFPGADGESGTVAADMSLYDLRTVVYNLQTILQNHIVRKHIAPRLGMPFLDLESATSVWRSGFVGGSAVSGPPTPLSTGSVGDAGQTPFQPPGAAAGGNSGGDCLRMCLPSPGLALEEFFIGSLLRLFDWGWGGTVRSETWTGTGFVPVRERNKHPSRTMIHTTKCA